MVFSSWFAKGKQSAQNKKSRHLSDSLFSAFSKIKQEFADHLEAINENTNEIQANYELYLKLENKIDKLESKIDQIDLFLQQFRTQQLYFLEEKETDSIAIEPLTDAEKRVFKAFYELNESSDQITYKSLSKTLKISLSESREYVTALIEKGVPIMKTYVNGTVYLALEPKFKDLQTKKNIISLK